MKIVQKCGPCGGELTVEHDDWHKLVTQVDTWRRDHACAQPDERGRAGTGFAATSTPATPWRDRYRQVVAREEIPNT